MIYFSYSVGFGLCMYVAYDLVFGLLFFVVVGFELRPLRLLGRHSTS
jgi:hypothetical protein